MPVKTLDTAVDVYALHRRWRSRFPFLLESVAQNAKLGRYDILFSKPQQVMTLNALSEDDFLSRFDQQWRAHRDDEDTGIPADIPFRGGWFVFFAYELAQQIEPKLALTAPPYPIAYAGKCASAIVVDKVAGRTHLVADRSDPDAIAELLQAIDELTTPPSPPAFTQSVCEDDDAGFLDGVEKARQYIIDGDVFQVNLSRGWWFDMPLAQRDALYAQLRHANPAPFAASCDLAFDGGEVSILSSSPERLISIRGGRIETRPIAGTRARGHDEASDKALSKELIGHLKERAEHVMLIDLERNDLGRICRAGTVRVDELMVIESYAHVHHIVSNVIGDLRAEVSPADAIRAVFPGGTITGCPKVRCMQIIHELEQTHRGVYTGSLGYVNHNGDMDSNILIRTFACHDGRVDCRAGAGVVFDSVPKHELKETRNKARGLLRAL
ncbi:MAG: aminodeoxychorismate synthase, component I [Gammaproteobacteria bacterium]|nr:MAG: aminodeoxychorismate synthase, component I [Gammaproteobacteria bacterium]